MFRPRRFTNNTIVVDTTIGDPGLIHLSGGVTVAPPSDNTAMVEVSGTFSADSGDKFSVAYRFAADLNATGHGRLHAVGRGEWNSDS